MNTLTSKTVSGTASTPVYRRSPHWLAVLAAVFTLPLLFVGGSVTTYGVGLAVPDWPTTFGINMFLYDFMNAPFGVQVEHTHRLYGAAVGLVTLALAVWLLIFDQRRWVKVLGVVALVAVIVQGVLGGTRVTQVSTFLAAAHGCLAQAFFGLMVALAVYTGKDWLETEHREADEYRFRSSSLALVALIYLQIVLGAWLRHYGTLNGLISHAFVATAVLGHGLSLAFRVRKHRDRVPFLVPAARVMAVLACVQVTLGLLAYWYFSDAANRGQVTTYEAMVRTGHQTNAALFLASAIVLSLRAQRHLSGGGDRSLAHQSAQRKAPGGVSPSTGLEGPA